MKLLRRLIAALTFSASVFTMIPMGASASDNSFQVIVDGVDCEPNGGNVYVYTNETNDIRYVKSDEYGTDTFKAFHLFVFNSESRMIEAGCNIYSNSATVTGSPQLTIKVPAGGFMVAFKWSTSAELRNCYNTVMEDAMLYNATMSVIYKATGSFSDGKLTIEYDNPKPVSENAKKFLFVGNSSTYFNGTPIKFKGLAEAAGVEIDVDYCTFGSAFLSEFADPTHERGKALRNKLNQNKYDYVVLQDAAKSDYYATKPQVETLLPLIEANGAEALLYMRYSAASTLEQIIKNAKKHHDNYATLAKDFDLVCSPSAHAFIYSVEKYPEIPLYADDGGHHSKEGSYLIAATWLYSYLGIDPVGNAYLADMPEDTAKKLQECAKLAIEQEYQFTEEKDIYKAQDGKDYNNIAIGKTYTYTGERYTNLSWSDTYDDGSVMGKLTDGKAAVLGDDSAIGAYSGKSHTVTIDLGSVSELKYIKTDIFGAAWGIPDPAEMKINILVSENGEDFQDLGELEMSEEYLPGGEWKKRLFTKEFDEMIGARYVKLAYADANFLWSSEINVYGIESNVEDSEESVIDETASEIEESVSTDGYKEPENKKNAWIYWLIGGVAAAGAVVASVIISKKKKK